MYDNLGARGFIPINIIIENMDGSNMTADASEEDRQFWQSELTSWSTEFGLTIPVVMDADYGAFYSFFPSGGGLPSLVLLDRGVVVNTVTQGAGAITEADIEALVGE